MFTLLYVRLSALLAVAILLAGCSAPDATRTTSGAPSLLPMEVSTASASLAPTDVLIQLDYEPTFFRLETFQPFGRIPVFTLLADGRLIYVSPGQPPGYDNERAMEAQLSIDQAADLVRQVLGLGFEHLEGYTDHCGKQEDGQNVCVEDRAYSILRVRMPTGELREIKNYAEFANDPQTLKAIYKLLSEYRNPAARPYKPEEAALFLRLTRGPANGALIQDWPLAPSWLTPPPNVRPMEGAAGAEWPPASSWRMSLLRERQWVDVLTGKDLATMLASVPRHMGDLYFRHAGRIYNAYLIPWLPGVDYTMDVRAYRQEALPAHSDR